MALNRINPVQIVLNSQNYVDFQEKQGGGKNRDFFENRNDAFVEHRNSLLSQVSSLKHAIANSSAGQTAFVKIKLRKEAWAKSHRPTQTLFTPKFFPSAGVDGLGEIYYRVSALKLPIVEAAISSAESTLEYKFNKRTEKKEPHPTRVRSEVGAIQEITLPDESDRRKFSAQEALHWLDDARSGKIYLLDVFNLPGSLGDFFNLPAEDQKLYENLTDILNSLKFGVLIFRSSVASHGSHNYLLIRPVKERQILSINSYFELWDESYSRFSYDDSLEDHEELLKLLSRHPLVRRVILPPIVQSVQNTDGHTRASKVLPVKVDGYRYPKVGVIDGGLMPAFGNWIIGKSGVIDPSHRSEPHGSFITGLLIAAREAGNSESVARESDGCEVVDIDIFPATSDPAVFSSYYPNGFEDFLLEMDLAIATAKQKFGVRIYNLSINIEQQVNDTIYSPFAELLDSIAQKHDVILVVSAGNLKYSNFRGAWPTKPGKVAAYLLPHAGNDRIFQPAESIFSISVGAVNPPDAPGHLEGAPTPYTRCGPGMKVGVKPDVCHYGGTTPSAPGADERLYSIVGDGRVLTGMGTSYAAPLVAKTLASIENQIEGHVPRENLIGLLIHRATVPSVLDHQELRTIARNFVGFGMPASSEECLLGDHYCPK